MKGKKIILKFLSFCLLIIGITSLAYSLYMLNVNSKAILLRDAMNKKEGAYAYVDLRYIVSFAQQGDDYTFYYGIDTDWENDKKIYIVNISNNTFLDIFQDSQDKGNSFHYILKGITYEIPDEVKERAIENIESLGELPFEVNEDNFEEYFGTYMLDSEAEFNATNSYVALGSGIVLIISSFVFLIALFKKRG